MFIDIAIMNFIEAMPRGGMVASLMAIFTHAGDKGYIWLGMGIGLWFRRETRPIAYGLFATMLVMIVANDLFLKPLIARPRPFVTYNLAMLLSPPPSGYAFPSGHASSSFAAAFFLVSFFRNKALPIFALAAIIALSRLYFNVHYFSDIVVGVIAGYVYAKIVLLTLAKPLGFKRYLKN